MDQASYNPDPAAHPGLHLIALFEGAKGVLALGIAVGLALLGPDRLREQDGVGPMAGQTNFRVIGAATTRSRGVRFGEIETMAETERAIRTAVQQEDRIGRSIVRMISNSILLKAEVEDRWEISPVLRLVFGADEVAAVTADLERMAAE